MSTTKQIVVGGLVGGVIGAIGGLLREARRSRARMKSVSDSDASARKSIAESLATAYADDEKMRKTVAWRIEQLVKAGFDELRAATIATTDADWRRAIALVEDGCDPVVAADIVLK